MWGGGCCEGASELNAPATTAGALTSGGRFTVNHHLDESRGDAVGITITTPTADAATPESGGGVAAIDHAAHIDPTRPATVAATTSTPIHPRTVRQHIQLCPRVCMRVCARVRVCVCVVSQLCGVTLCEINERWGDLWCYESHRPPHLTCTAQGPHVVDHGLLPLAEGELPPAIHSKSAGF
jgi:hypothetical protein